MGTSELIARYDRFAGSYHRWWAPVIAPAGVRLLDLIDEAVTGRSTAVVVDVGAGTGTVARAAVARWPTVRVVAIDASGVMLELGRSEAARTLPGSAARRLRWVRGTADRLPLPEGSADAVVSSFTLQHLPSRIAALREAARVLRPGGLLAVVTWMAEDWPFEPVTVFDDLLRELAVVRPKPSHIPRPFRSLRAASALARRAGFRQVQATAGVVEHRWDLEGYLACKLNYGERLLLDALDPATRARVETLCRERLGRLDPAALVYRGPVGYVTGRRPGPNLARRLPLRLNPLR